MTRLQKQLIGCTSLLALAGCGNPYALNTASVNYDAKPIQGSITISDLKLHRREALVRERQEEIQRIRGLQVLSAGDDFAILPEFIRQIDYVSSLSAALGLKFDPAAGEAFRQNSEMSEIKNEIALTRLRMELAELKRNAELLEAKLKDPAYQAPSSTNGKDGVNGTNGKDASLSAAQLLAALTALTTATDKLTTAASTPLAAINKSNITRHPIDAFRDVNAYRDVLKTALNAASLDALHDADGHTLVRLDLNATVLPPPDKYRNAIGLVRMTFPEPKRPEYGELFASYTGWLNHMNEKMNKKGGGLSSEIYRILLDGRLGNPLYYLVDDKDLVSDKCSGLSTSRPDISSTCRIYTFLAPKIEFAGIADSTDTTLDAIAQPFWARNPGVTTIQENLIDAQQKLRAYAKTSTFPRQKIGQENIIQFTNCIVGLNKGLENEKIRLGQNSEANLDTFRAMAIQSDVAAFIVRNAEITANLTIKTSIGYQRESNLLSKMEDYREIFTPFLIDYANLVTEKCGYISTNDLTKLLVPYRYFEMVFQPAGRWAAYNVSPREQAQQVSTMARATETLGLALSASGSSPGKGLNADAALAYARSASGKVDALERVPQIVSFVEGESFSTPPNDQSTANNRTRTAFGWAIAPQLSLDPKGRSLELNHNLKPYDLTADLVVPGWLPYIELDVQTVWGRALRNGKTHIDESVSPPRRIKVSLKQTTADYEAMTEFFLGNYGAKTVKIYDVIPRTISSKACNIALQIVGKNVWRAESIYLGGKKLRDARVLADMRGVEVDLDNAIFPALVGSKAHLQVRTLDGSDTFEEFTIEGEDTGSCPGKTAAQPTATMPATTGAAADTGGGKDKGK